MLTELIICDFNIFNSVGGNIFFSIINSRVAQVNPLSFEENKTDWRIQFVDIMTKKQAIRKST